MAGELPWHLAALEVPQLAARGLSGRGITVGVVDTGVRRDHPMLAGRDVRALDVRGGGYDGNDLHGHGTAMVGLLAGQQGAIVPDASIVSVKALFAGPMGTASDLVSGVELALSQKVDVLSLSVGASDITPALSQLIQNAIREGVVVVAAGDDADDDAPLFPGALTPVIAVTAANQEGGTLFDTLPAWLDLAVPGVELPTLTLGGVATSTGTSPATAVCAGICALLLGLAPATRCRELGAHLMEFLSSTGKPLAAAAGPNVPKLLSPLAAADAISRWLVG
jgi:subtilisin family serine protease